MRRHRLSVNGYAAQKPPKVVIGASCNDDAPGIEMQPDGSRAYVACTPDSYVVVIDLKSLEVTAHIEAGKNPDGMAWCKR